ncbi:SGNH/GDSL hydrolase family protein [Lentibacillus sp. CBA3610]|uniref:SGNH/GDSL hydrolase family protein n=1 Tax=Lentibacillus sp. CBA3610 TaxID=2518176 RepID=UPI0015959E3B|nr:SGNH/GDSL hydrolase family protein [Lentibacillus sp. CBA3610]QKY70547.1 hypothetical protein Len3610_13965 [Lentibacillus sp. CBA3610]
MKRRYVFIILGLLLAGITVFLAFGQTETTINKSSDDTAQYNQEEDTEKSADETDNQGETSHGEASAEASEEPISQLQALLNAAVQRTIDFFTNRDAHITAIGDSLTQGVGDDVVDGGYIGILDNRINEQSQLVSFDNYGKRGNRSNQLLNRLKDPEIEQSIENADMVLITVGANDIMQVVKENFTNLQVNDFTPAKDLYEANLQQIFEKINDLNVDAEIYLVGIYNPFLNYFEGIDELDMIVSSWNQTSQNVTEQYDNTTFIPIADLFDEGENDLFADDNFHPNHRGYQLFARRVLEYLPNQ